MGRLGFRTSFCNIVQHDEYQLKVYGVRAIANTVLVWDSYCYQVMFHLLQHYMFEQ